MPDYPMVELGVDEHGKTVHEIPVYPQRHAYIENRIGKFADVLVNGIGGLDDLEASSVLNAAGSKVYELLCALLPNMGKRIPEYEFRGYGSKDAYEAGEYNETQDRSPSFPQIVAAFETAIEINRFDVFKALKAVIDPKALRVRISEAILDWDGSLNSLGTSGESPQSDSGTTGQISDDESGRPDTASANGSGSLLTTSA